MLTGFPTKKKLLLSSRRAQLIRGRWRASQITGRPSARRQSPAKLILLKNLSESMEIARADDDDVQVLGRELGQATATVAGTIYRFKRQEAHDRPLRHPGAGRTRRQRCDPPRGPRRPPQDEPGRRRTTGASRASGMGPGARRRPPPKARPRRARRHAVAARPPPLGISKNIP